MPADSSRITAQHGRNLVARELEARGWTVQETTVDNRPVLLVASEQGRRVVRVSAKRQGTWQTSTAYGVPNSPPETHSRLWVFVNLESDPPQFFVVPEAWMVEDIWAVHERYVTDHGGARARSPRSTHHKIETGRIARWRDRWDLLGGDAL